MAVELPLRVNSTKRSDYLAGRFIALPCVRLPALVEPHVGVEPTTSPWQGDILPLN